MTTIPAVRTSAHAPTSAATEPVQDPNELVGNGEPSARWFGGVAGAALGIGGTVGAMALLRVPSGGALRFASLPLGAGGAFLGQHLLGKATRSTVAETARAREAEQQDLELQIRQLRAKDSLDDAQIARVEELRRERRSLIEARSEGSKVATWGAAAVGAAAVATVAGALAHKLTPDDGKGINQMFNAMMAGGIGAGVGFWGGGTLGSLVGRGERHAEIPPGNVAKIAEVDRELDSLLGPA